MDHVSKYFSLVKFSHTIFAMPFAIIGFVYATTQIEVWEEPWWMLLTQVILCMVLARNVAMGFNRWADRDIDAKNPRTAQREIPSGAISSRKAMRFITINALLFVALASSINILTALLSPVALLIIIMYSYCKRFTALSHIVLGLSLSIAPIAAYIAVTGEFAIAPCVLSTIVLTWCAGFDIIYALQDAEFDRKNRLHSIPSKYSARTSLSISIALHVVTVIALLWFVTYCPQSTIMWVGVVIFIALIILQHILVTPTKQKNIGIAFGTINGLASTILAICIVIDLLK